MMKEKWKKGMEKKKEANKVFIIFRIPLLIILFQVQSWKVLILKK